MKALLKKIDQDSIIVHEVILVLLMLFAVIALGLVVNFASALLGMKHV